MYCANLFATRFPGYKKALQHIGKDICKDEKTSQGRRLSFDKERNKGEEMNIQTWKYGECSHHNKTYTENKVKPEF